AGALRHLDKRHPAQHRARVAALVAGAALAADQAAGLVEMQRGNRQAAAPGHLAHAQPVAAARMRRTAGCRHRLTSSLLEVLACHTPKTRSVRACPTPPCALPCCTAATAASASATPSPPGPSPRSEERRGGKKKT